MARSCCRVACGGDQHRGKPRAPHHCPAAALSLPAVCLHHLFSTGTEVAQTEKFKAYLKHKETITGLGVFSQILVPKSWELPVSVHLVTGNYTVNSSPKTSGQLLSLMLGTTNSFSCMMLLKVQHQSVQSFGRSSRGTESLCFSRLLCK